MSTGQDTFLWLHAKVHHIMNLPLAIFSNRKLLVRLSALQPAEGGDPANFMEEEILVSKTMPSSSEQSTETEGSALPEKPKQVLQTLLRQCEGDFHLRIKSFDTESGHYGVAHFSLEVLHLYRLNPDPAVPLARESVVTVNIDLDVDAVLEKKIKPQLLSTCIGEIAVSFSVSTKDVKGFRNRLTEFLSQYNPESVPHIDQIVQKVGEVDVFTKLRKRYGVVDYRKRLKRFILLYQLTSKEEVDQVMNTTLANWELQEEELFEKLVVDNGPEPWDIPREDRLNAMKLKYNNQVDVAGLDHKNTLKELSPIEFEKRMEALCNEHGPEPIPTMYLFHAVGTIPRLSDSVEVSSSSAPPQASGFPKKAAKKKEHEVSTLQNDYSPSPYQQQRQSGQYFPSHASPPRGDPTVTGYAPMVGGSLPNQFHTSPNRAMDWNGQVGGDQRLEAYHQRRQCAGSPRVEPSSPPSRTFIPQIPLAELIQPDANLQNLDLLPRNPDGSFLSLEEIRRKWKQLKTALEGQGISEQSLYYLNDERFYQICVELGVGEDAQALSIYMMERHRRIYGSTHFVYLSTQDPVLSGAYNDLLQISGLSTLQCTPHAVMVVENKVHQHIFNTKFRSYQRQIQKCYALADSSRAMEIVYFGFQKMPVNFTDQVFTPFMKLNYEVSRASEGTSLSCGPAISSADISGGHRILSTAIVLCDVFVGNCLDISVDAPYSLQELSSPMDGPPYDSVRARKGFPDETLVVYSAQQILPKLVLWCSIDFDRIGCVHHPSVACVNLDTQRLAQSRGAIQASEPPLCMACFREYSGNPHLHANFSKQRDTSQRSVWRDPMLIDLGGQQASAGILESLTASSPWRAKMMETRANSSQQGIASKSIPMQQLSSITDPMRMSFQDSALSGAISPSSSSSMPQESVIVNPNDAHNANLELQARQLIAQGMRQYRSGYFESAANLWRQVVHECGIHCSGTYEAKGILAEIVDKDSSSAVRYYQQGLQVNPSATSLLFRCGNLLETKCHRYEEALNMFELAQQLGDEASARRCDLLRKRHMRQYRTDTGRRNLL